MKTLILYLAVAAAGAVGSVLRLFVIDLCKRIPLDFPIATLLINITGSFFLGWFYTVATSRMNISETTRLAVGVGFVGAYTTFSTFMFDSDSMISQGAFNKAGLNLFGSLILGLAAVHLGIRLASR